MSSSFVSFLPTYAKGSRDSARRRCRFDGLLSSGILSLRSSFESTMGWNVFGDFLAFLDIKIQKKLREIGKNDRLIP